jgi:hypothetical protein
MLWSTPKLGKRTRIQLQNRIANLLRAQIAVLTDPVIQDISGDLNRKAVGYVYGYVSGYLRTEFHLEHMDTWIRIASKVLQDLFGGYKREEYARFLMHNLNERLVTTGMVAGDREVQDYLNNRNATPIGLARFILEGEKLNMAKAWSEGSYLKRPLGGWPSAALSPRR